jgi:hypothetical protein
MKKKGKPTMSSVTDVPKEYVAQTGLDDLVRTLEEHVVDHMRVAATTSDLILEHAGVVSRMLLRLAAQVAVEGQATVDGAPLRVDLFGQLASAHFVAAAESVADESFNALIAAGPGGSYIHRPKWLR